MTERSSSRAATIAHADAVAICQHGCLSRTQLRALGISDRTISRWAAEGRLRRLQPHAYAMAGSPATDHQRLMAAVLSVSPDGLASHRAAGWLWGLLDAPFLEVTVSRARRPRLTADVVVHHPLDLHKARRSIKDGIPVTNPLRTLADLGAVLPDEAVAGAVETALIKRVVTFRGLVSEWQRVAKPGRRGSGVLRRILDTRLLGDKPADSVLEVRAAPLFSRVGWPNPAFQYSVMRDGKAVARVDFAYVELRVAIEFDGLDAHASAVALQRDLRRQNELIAAGWIVLRFTWSDVVNRPERVASQIRRVLESRQAA